MHFIVHPIGRLRLIGGLEGLSYILLLGIAMPLKYGAGMPEFVKVAGWIHGGLFTLFFLLIAHAWFNKAIPFKWFALLFIGSMLPFGPFVLDGKLKALPEPAA